MAHPGRINLISNCPHELLKSHIPEAIFEQDFVDTS